MRYLGFLAPFGVALALPAAGPSLMEQIRNEMLEEINKGATSLIIKEKLDAGIKRFDRRRFALTLTSLLSATMATGSFILADYTNNSLVKGFAAGLGVHLSLLTATIELFTKKRCKQEQQKLIEVS